jgi:hypothetical protein
VETRAAAEVRSLGGLHHVDPRGNQAYQRGRRCLSLHDQNELQRPVEEVRQSGGPQIPTLHSHHQARRNGPLDQAPPPEGIALEKRGVLGLPVEPTRRELHDVCGAKGPPQLEQAASDGVAQVTARLDDHAEQVLFAGREILQGVEGLADCIGGHRIQALVKRAELGEALGIDPPRGEQSQLRARSLPPLVLTLHASFEQNPCLLAGVGER